VVHVSPSGLVTVVGGKWTTYRKMAEDAVEQAIVVGDLPPAPCRTRGLRIHGAPAGDPAAAATAGPYGSERDAVEELCAKRPEWAERVHPELELRGGEVVWAARHEMARRVEDVLSRRSRALLCNARAAAESAPAVAALLAGQLGRDEAWAAAEADAFRALAQRYTVAGASPGV
jgi:glycerol-3-phosphate dehydrogenase